ncbi:MAG: restriction endonuclease subunit S, partial [Albidovulum sp.]|uniref:restriction endonuclease subunit S n=1 Tax=Albidovulum sp. TaxID=1872424 RepID=UPI003CC0E8A2
MNAEDLLHHYARISEAPDAIPKLRRFVLDLAVRGKLMEQDAADEPASDLLKRIAAEKARLVKAKEIRRPKEMDAISPEDYGVSHPETWCLERLGNLSTVITKGSTPTSYGHAYTDNGVNFIKVESIVDGRISEKSITSFISDETHEFLARSKLHAGDLLFSIAGSIGTCALVTPETVPANTNQALAIIRGTSIPYDADFLILILRSSVSEAIKEKARGGAMNNVSLTDLQNLIVPIPPLAEQHRIVAKVDELMALCDRLEEARAGREGVRDKLTAASLARLTAPETTEPDFQSHARSALQTLPALTTRPDQIKPLRQTILNLAVRGKLVAQDAADEPAAELLKRFKAAKIAHKQATGDARNKLAPDADESSYPVGLPDGWAVQSFENLFLFIDYRGNTPPKTEGGVPLITAKNVRMGALNREPREYISEKTFKAWMSRGFPKLGDLFFTTEAPLANICLNDIQEPFALAQRVICFQPYAEINTRYLMLTIQSDVMQALIDEQATGMTAKGIKAAKLKPLPIPLPPLAEQHRIVA